MQAQKFSISVAPALVTFLEAYQKQHHFHSRSEVIASALKLLQKAELESAYFEAYQELDEDFEGVSGDGIEDETW